MTQATARPFWICLALMALALLAYWPATRAEFVQWDDQKTVLANPALVKPSWPAFLKRWTEPYLGMYMPITQTFYQAAALVGRVPTEPGKYDLNPWVFHWGMILIRLLNIPLVFVFLRRIVGDDWAAAAGAGLMALHPIGDEAFAWISEVSMPLCVLFAVACLWQWLVFRQEPRHRAWHLSAAIVLYLLALLTKPICVCIPVMAWALDVWVVGIDWKRSLLHLLPAVVPVALLAVLMGHLQEPPEYLWVPPLWQRPFVAIDAIAFYIGRILAPLNLGIDYGRTPHWVLLQHRMLLFEGVAIVLLLIALWLLRWRRPMLICAAIFFVAGMGAVLGLMPFWFQSYSTVADRYAYLPMLGIALATASLLAGVRVAWPWVIVSVVLALCIGLTFRQARTWRTTDTLYAHARQVDPNSWMAWNGTGYELIDNNRPVEGLALTRVAYALDPNQEGVLSNIGTALAMLGDPGQALPYFRRVMLKDHTNGIVAMNLGAAYVQLGQYDLGIKWLQFSIKIDPDSIKAHRLLAGAIQLRDAYDRLSTRP